MQEQVFKSLGRVRVLELKNIIKTFDVSEKELDKWVEKALMKKEFIQEGQSVRVYYELTEAGEFFLKEQYHDFEEVYRGFDLEHDLVLSNYYMECTESEQNSWKTKDDLAKAHRLPGTLDGVFTREDGKLAGIKVIAKNAKPSTIQRAEAFIEAIGIEAVAYLLHD